MIAMFPIIKAAPPLGSRCQYPFDGMDVGDAFNTPRDMGLTTAGTDRRQANVSCAANHWAKRHNPAARFSVRLLDSNTVRCRREA